jgi:arginine/lysine/ornithine decarboxylase
LDIARRELALNGKERIATVKERVKNAAKLINQIPGFEAITKKNVFESGAVYDFDESKLAVNTYKTGLTGIEVYNILRKEYNVQLEFGDISNILAIPAIGDDRDYCVMLAEALNDIAKKYSRVEKPAYVYEYIKPIVKIPPRDAFYYPKEKISIANAVGRISSEYITCYPPGIPLIAPGEIITEEIVGHIEYAKRKGCKIIGGEGENNYILVVK